MLNNDLRCLTQMAYQVKLPNQSVRPCPSLSVSQQYHFTSVSLHITCNSVPVE